MSIFGSLFENCGKFYLPGREPSTGEPIDPITPPTVSPTGGPRPRPPFTPVTPDPPGGGGPIPKPGLGQGRGGSGFGPAAQGPSSPPPGTGLTPVTTGTGGPAGSGPRGPATGTGGPAATGPGDTVPGPRTGDAPATGGPGGPAGVGGRPIPVRPPVTGGPGGPATPRPIPVRPPATGGPGGPATGGRPIPVATEPPPPPPPSDPNEGVANPRFTPIGIGEPPPPEPPIVTVSPRVIQDQMENGQTPGFDPTESALQAQESNINNVVFRDPNEEILVRDRSTVDYGISEPKLYDPELNFFSMNLGEETSYIPQSDRRYKTIFKDNISKEIHDLINYQGSSSWNEKSIQNITDNMLINSLRSDLILAFQVIRYPGGEPVGFRSLLEMVRKHIRTGTLDEFDPEFYLDLARGQVNTKFELLSPPLNKEYAERFTIDYLAKNGVTLKKDKKNKFQNIQIQRGRLLNEDLDVNFKLVMRDTSQKTMRIPNDGFFIGLSGLPGASFEIPVPTSIGRRDRVNIGDGMGYYLHTIKEDGEEVAINSENRLDSSYYIPPHIKAKTLKLNNEPYEFKVVASSLPNKHEYISGDKGASAFGPLYFGINLSSVTTAQRRSSLVETYNAQYSLIQDSDQISEHINNNALSMTQVQIDYKDPLYRYIHDTSGFTLTQNDFTMQEFKGKGFSSINYNYPKNIPFVLVVVPIAGSKFNPLNITSELDSYGGEVHVRSLDFKPGLYYEIDKEPRSELNQYNLYNEKGTTGIGLMESGDYQSWGYEYVPSSYYNTFFNGTDYTTSSNVSPVSSYGTSYLLREVLDYINDTYDTSTVSWFDIFSRMPLTRIGELYYDMKEGFVRSIADGFRHNIEIKHIAKGNGTQESLILPEDSKVVVTVIDRKFVTRRVEGVK